MIHQVRTVLFTGVLGIICFPAFAKISLNTDFQGTVVITQPDGELVLLEPGDAIPEIPSGSTIEVIDGTVSISSEAGDKVEVACLDHSASASGAGSVSLNCAEDSGAIKVVQGQVTLTDPNGTQTELEAGKEFAFQRTAAAQTPEPTAATTNDSATSPETDSEPDTRSLEASPST